MSCTSSTIPLFLFGFQSLFFSLIHFQSGSIPCARSHDLTTPTSRRLKRRTNRRFFHKTNNDYHHDLNSSEEESNTRISMQNLTCHFFPQPLDHFSPSTNLTFQQRYCLYDGYERKTVQNRLTSPIFFYTGNESPLEEYVNNTGLMYELAAKEYLSALIVFAEHRFEGKSVPDFDVLLDSNIGCFSYLTSSQALADFASLLSFLNPNYDRPVIAFGGSYGGMLSSWLRMKYPGSVDGAIASSAPIFGLPLTIKGDITNQEKPREGDMPNDGTMDGAFHIIGDAIRRNIVGDPGRADDEENFCFDNLLAAWPLITFFGKFSEGRDILSQEFALCSPLKTEIDVDKLIEWAQSPWFDLAEADYPYESSYIPFALGEGDYKLPAWPLHEACHGDSRLASDMDISIMGDRANVTFDIFYGRNSSLEESSNLILHVDWDQVTIPAERSWKMVHGPGIDVARTLLSSVRKAVSIWFNVTQKMDCFDVVPATNKSQMTPTHDVKIHSKLGFKRMKYSDSYECHEKLQNDTVWTSLVCNENMYLITTYARGMGRDFFWPPSHKREQLNYRDTISNRSQVEADYMALCSDPHGIFGYPMKDKVDPWAKNLDDLYGGTRIKSSSNIIFSNGLLDPWSAAGVFSRNASQRQLCQMDVRDTDQGFRAFEYPCSMVQNVTADGSIVALVLDLGAHHLDLMYSDKNDPECAKYARMIEEAYILQWIDEWIDRNHKEKFDTGEDLLLANRSGDIAIE